MHEQERASSKRALHQAGDACDLTEVRMIVLNQVFGSERSKTEGLRHRRRSSRIDQRCTVFYAAK